MLSTDYASAGISVRRRGEQRRNRGRGAQFERAQSRPHDFLYLNPNAKQPSITDSLFGEADPSFYIG